MTRKTYTVTVETDDGSKIGATVAYAMNSGIRKSEAIVREYARARGVYYLGDMPYRDSEGRYRRTWQSLYLHALRVCVSEANTEKEDA